MLVLVAIAESNMYRPVQQFHNKMLSNGILALTYNYVHLNMKVSLNFCLLSSSSNSSISNLKIACYLCY